MQLWKHAFTGFFPQDVSLFDFIYFFLAHLSFSCILYIKLLFLHKSVHCLHGILNMHMTYVFLPTHRTYQTPPWLMTPPRIPSIRSLPSIHSDLRKMRYVIQNRKKSLSVNRWTIFKGQYWVYELKDFHNYSSDNKKNIYRNDLIYMFIHVD